MCGENDFAWSAVVPVCDHDAGKLIDILMIRDLGGGLVIWFSSVIDAAGVDVAESQCEENEGAASSERGELICAGAACVVCVCRGLNARLCTHDQPSSPASCPLVIHAVSLPRSPSPSHFAVWTFGVGVQKACGTRKTVG